MSRTPAGSPACAPGPERVPASARAHPRRTARQGGGFRSRARRGAAIVVSLVIFAVLGLFLTTFVSIDLAHREALAHATLSAQSLAAAEGGLDLGREIATREGPWSGTREFTVADRISRVTATLDGDRLTLVSTTESLDGARRAAIRLTAVHRRRTGGGWVEVERQESSW